MLTLTWFESSSQELRFCISISSSKFCEYKNLFIYSFKQLYLSTYQRSSPPHTQDIGSRIQIFAFMGLVLQWERTGNIDAKYMKHTR